MVSISYAVTTHNEHKELEHLIPYILNNMSLADELVILDDYSDYKTRRIFDKYIHNKSYNIVFEERSFNNDFATHKNYLNSICNNKWIFNIDADEIPHQNLFTNIKKVIEENPNIELYWVPRVNTVKGMTQEHATQFGWRLNDQGWVNYPDPQQRIYKNAPHIKWNGNVHERLEGATVDTVLPYEEEWSIYHPKTIEKQIAQNKKYAGISR